MAGSYSSGSRRGETGAGTGTATRMRVPKPGGGMLVRGHRRAAPSTPVPSWKVFNNQLYDGMSKPPPPSARKLAASLWELQDLPVPACFSACLQTPHARDSPQAQATPSLADDSAVTSPHSQPDYVLSPPMTSRKTGSSRHEHQAHLRKLFNRSSMESPVGLVDRQRHSSLFASSVRKLPGESGAGTMSQELLKMFSQVRVMEEQHNCSLSLTTALHGELLQAHARVRELEQNPQRKREVEILMKKFAEEKAAWKLKEKAKLKAVKEQLEEERSVRQRVENANRQLTKELMEAQSAASKAVQELEKERKARQLIEEVCHELAQETGEDKAEVEEMKRQSQKVREELEEERRMLQLAEVWREERVQMKLGEAKLALEEKTAALDVMTGELESFLDRAQHHLEEQPCSSQTVREAQVLQNVIHAIVHTTQADHPEPTLYYPEGIPDAD